MANILTFETPVLPSRDTEINTEVKLKTIDFGDGYEQVAPDGINHMRRTVSLKWEMLLPDQAEAMVKFFREHGGYKSFYYTLSDTLTPIKWKCRVWKDVRGKSGLRTITATFVESFE